MLQSVSFIAIDLLFQAAKLYVVSLHVGRQMAAKVTNCYRFLNVDFEPQNRLLIWQDNAMTSLTDEECRLLSILCRHAGETLSIQALFQASRTPTTNFEQHQSALNSLLSKSFYCGKKILPMELVGNYGYRIALPKETIARRNQQLIAELDPSFMTAKPPSKKKFTANKFDKKKASFCVGILLLFALFFLLFHLFF